MLEVLLLLKKSRFHSLDAASYSDPDYYLHCYRVYPSEKTGIACITSCSSGLLYKDCGGKHRPVRRMVWCMVAIRSFAEMKDRGNCKSLLGCMHIVMADFMVIPLVIENEGDVRWRS